MVLLDSQSIILRLNKTINSNQIKSNQIKSNQIKLTKVYCALNMPYAAATSDQNRSEERSHIESIEEIGFESNLT